jgi:DNA-binding NarL/FixJ family response regulator
MITEIRILIADDHPVVRQGLKQIIEADPEIKVIAEAGDGRNALSQIKTLLPDIAVLDINMPGADGLMVAQTISDEGLLVGIILLTAHREEDLFNRALEVGVKGYVLKDSATTDITSAIKAVAAGQYYTSPAMSGYLVKRRSSKPPTSDPSVKDLTPTERRILGLLADYKTSREIAEELFISYRTVQTHRVNICQKLGLQGNHALMKFALEYKSELE